MKFTWSYTSNKELNVESFPTKTMQSYVNQKFHVLRFMLLIVYLLRIIITIVFVLKPILGGGGPRQSHLTPLSTRTTHKELNAESFPTEMMQSYVN